MRIKSINSDLFKVNCCCLVILCVGGDYSLLHRILCLMEKTIDDRIKCIL